MKKYIGVLFLILIIFALGACAPKNEVEDNSPQIEEPIENEANIQDEEDEVVDPTPERESKEVHLYFANGEYIETGDESLEKLVVEKRLVEFGDVPLEERVVRELMKGPENIENASTVIPSTVKLLGVEVADGTAYVNFAQEGMYGGSMQETFTINQIVASLLDLDSVDRVQFLIDGKKAETLMGHYSIEEPFESITE